MPLLWEYENRSFNKHGLDDGVCTGACAAWLGNILSGMPAQRSRPSIKEVKRWHKYAFDQYFVYRIAPPGSATVGPTQLSYKRLVIKLGDKHRLFLRTFKNKEGKMKYKMSSFAGDKIVENPGAYFIDMKGNKHTVAAVHTEDGDYLYFDPNQGCYQFNDRLDFRIQLIHDFSTMYKNSIAQTRLYPVVHAGLG